VADGARAGFAIETLDGEFLGLGMFVRIEHEGRQGEIGYVVGPRRADAASPRAPCAC
jgi:hypothetical protein